MTNQLIDAGTSRFIGTYSDAVLVPANARWLVTSGTPGLDADGKAPEGIEAQTRVAFENVFRVLGKARMTSADIVKVTTTLTREADIPAYVKVRKELLGGIKPAFMLQVVKQMIRPDFLVEVEVTAAAALEPVPEEPVDEGWS
jgi:2-iminobutanoate/2-iminopropanoate deaminase